MRALVLRDWHQLDGVVEEVEVPDPPASQDPPSALQVRHLETEPDRQTADAPERGDWHVSTRRLRRLPFAGQEIPLYVPDGRPGDPAGSYDPVAERLEGRALLEAERGVYAEAAECPRSVAVHRAAVEAYADALAELRGTTQADEVERIYETAYLGAEITNTTSRDGGYDAGL